MTGGMRPARSVDCRRETEGACAWASDLAAELEVARQSLRRVEAELLGHREENERFAALTGQLQQAMASRPVIEQAKGVIVAETGYDPERAFGRLVAVSRSRNVKVRDLARAIVVRAQRPKRARRNRRPRGPGSHADC